MGGHESAIERASERASLVGGSPSVRDERRNRERAVLSEENAENSSYRLCDGGEASAKRVADTGVGSLIREHREELARFDSQ